MKKKTIGIALALALGATVLASPAIAYTKSGPVPTAVSVCTVGTAKISWDTNAGKPSFWAASSGGRTGSGTIPNSAMSKGFANVSWANFNPGQNYDITLSNSLGTSTVNFTATC